jgi:tetratricopeptide (TPR) repeat protein
MSPLRPTLAAVLFALAFAAPARAVVALEAQVDAGAKSALPAAEAYAKAHAKDARAWFLLARARLQAGKAQPGIDAAEHAVKLAPDDAQAHRLLGNAYAMRIGQVGMLGKMTLAPKVRGAFERAVALDPNLIEARFALMEYYLQAPGAMGGGLDKAQAQAAQIARRDPAQGHLAQARLAGFDERKDEAAKHYASALAARPADPKVRLAVAVGYQQLERWDEALKLLRAWLVEHPADVAALYQLGRTAALSGRALDEGAAALERYLVLPRRWDDPEPKHALLRLGQVHAKAGRAAQARQAFDRALALDPKFADAKDARAKL